MRDEDIRCLAQRATLLPTLVSVTACQGDAGSGAGGDCSLTSHSVPGCCLARPQLPTSPCRCPISSSTQGSGSCLQKGSVPSEGTVQAVSTTRAVSSDVLRLCSVVSHREKNVFHGPVFLPEHLLFASVRRSWHYGGPKSVQRDCPLNEANSESAASLEKRPLCQVLPARLLLSPKP